MSFNLWGAGMCELNLMAFHLIDSLQDISLKAKKGGNGKISWKSIWSIVVKRLMVFAKLLTNSSFYSTLLSSVIPYIFSSPSVSCHPLFSSCQLQQIKSIRHSQNYRFSPIRKHEHCSSSHFLPFSLQLTGKHLNAKNRRFSPDRKHAPVHTEWML